MKIWERTRAEKPEDQFNKLLRIVHTSSPYFKNMKWKVWNIELMNLNICVSVSFPIKGIPLQPIPILTPASAHLLGDTSGRYGNPLVNPKGCQESFVFHEPRNLYKYPPLIGQSFCQPSTQNLGISKTILTGYQSER